MKELTKAILLSPFYLIGNKTWKEFKSGLIKHEHDYDYENPIYIEHRKYYPCKHLGCSLVEPYNI